MIIIIIPINTLVREGRQKGCQRLVIGLNGHVNYGLGDSFRGVTTIYENTALPKNKPLVVKLDQPILLPAGEALHIRVLPWYDSNGSPQKGHCIQLGELRITGKKLL